MIYPGILTLPGTVGRGFCFPMGNSGTWIFACYANIRKQRMGFSYEKLRTKNRNAVFFGMEAAAQNR